MLSADEFASFIQMNKILQTKTISSGDRLLVGTSDGVRSTPISREWYYSILDNVLLGKERRTILRGKNLGERFTEKQFEAIADGSFKGMFIGDYWLIGGKHWRIADFDYWYGRNAKGGYSYRHHVVLFPDEGVYDFAMFDTADTSPGFKSSNAHKGQADIGGYAPLNYATKIISDMVGLDHLYIWIQFVNNGMNNGSPSSILEIETGCMIPSEAMVFGTHFFRPMNAGSGTYASNYSTEPSQLALLALNNEFIPLRDGRAFGYWLSDPANTANYCEVWASGRSSTAVVTEKRALRPIICVM